MTLQSGEVVAGRYRVLGLLGRGGYGAVYQAEDLHLASRRVALKESIETTPEYQAQFELEARLLAGLSHPNLPRVSDYFVEPPGAQFLVMDLVEGDELSRVLTRRSRVIDETETLRWMLQVCRAVAYLHNLPQPVIHRDIKPPNIKVTREGRAVLVDFGIAKVYNPKMGTAPVARAVSRYYSSPEQYVGMTDTRSDVYSLGATLYALACHQSPTDALDRFTDGAALLPPRSLNPLLSLEIESVILRALALPPDERYYSGAELADAIQAVLTGTAALSPPPNTGSLTCPHCFVGNRLAARYCRHCGRPLPSGQAASGLASGALPQLRFEAGKARAATGALDEAIVEYRAALEGGFDRPALYFHLGQTLLESGQAEEARALLARGTARFPDDAELCLQLARAYLALDQFPNALASTRQAQRLAPADVAPVLLMAEVFDAAKQSPEAAVAYRQALAMDAHQTEAYFRLGRALTLAGQPEAALSPLHHALELDPARAEARFYLGMALAKQKQYDRALVELREATRLNTTNAPAHYYIGDALYALGDYDEAILAYEQSARLKTDDPDPLVDIGYCHALRGRTAEARSAVARALAIDPAHPRALALQRKLNVR